MFQKQLYNVHENMNTSFLQRSECFIRIFFCIYVLIFYSIFFQLHWSTNIDFKKYSSSKVSFFSNDEYENNNYIFKLVFIYKIYKNTKLCKNIKMYTVVLFICRILTSFFGNGEMMVRGEK